MATLEPITRVEQFLSDIIDQGGGGGGSGGGGVVVVTMNMETMALDKTWQEIQTAMATSVVVIYQAAPDYGFWAHLYVTQVRSDEYGNYIIEVNNGDQFRATSASGYPVYYNPI